MNSKQQQTPTDIEGSSTDTKFPHKNKHFNDIFATFTQTLQ